MQRTCKFLHHAMSTEKVLLPCFLGQTGCMPTIGCVHQLCQPVAMQWIVHWLISLELTFSDPFSCYSLCDSTLDNSTGVYSAFNALCYVRTASTLMKKRIDAQDLQPLAVDLRDVARAFHLPLPGPAWRKPELMVFNFLNELLNYDLSNNMAIYVATKLAPVLLYSLMCIPLVYAQIDHMVPSHILQILRTMVLKTAPAGIEILDEVATTNVLKLQQISCPETVCLRVTVAAASYLTQYPLVNVGTRSGLGVHGNAMHTHETYKQKLAELKAADQLPQPGERFVTGIYHIVWSYESYDMRGKQDIGVVRLTEDPDTNTVSAEGFSSCGGKFKLTKEDEAPMEANASNTFRFKHDNGLEFVCEGLFGTLGWAGPYMEARNEHADPSQRVPLGLFTMVKDGREYSDEVWNSITSKISAVATERKAWAMQEPWTLKTHEISDKASIVGAFAGLTSRSMYFSNPTATWSMILQFASGEMTEMPPGPEDVGRILRSAYRAPEEGDAHFQQRCRCLAFGLAVHAQAFVAIVATFESDVKTDIPILKNRFHVNHTETLNKWRQILLLNPADRMYSPDHLVAELETELRAHEQHKKTQALTDVAGYENGSKKSKKKRRGGSSTLAMVGVIAASALSAIALAGAAYFLGRKLAERQNRNRD